MESEEGRMTIQDHRGRFAVLFLLGCCHSLSFGVGPFKEARQHSKNKSVRSFEPGRSRSILSSKWRKSHQENEVELLLKHCLFGGGVLILEL